MTTLITGSEKTAAAAQPGLRTLPSAAILIAAIALRGLAIAERPLWYDESFSVLFAEKGLGAMIRGTLSPVSGAAADVHPLGYYAALHYWMRLFGSSPGAVRALSVLIGFGLLLAAYGLAKDLFGARIARWAALFVAFSPFQIHYAQEARMYVLLALFLLGATWALLRALRTGAARWWSLFAITAVMAQYTHHLAFCYLVPLALTPLWLRDRQGIKNVALSSVVALLLYTPWLIQIPAQFSKVSQSYWTARPGGERFLTVALTFVTNLPLPELLLAPGLFVTLLVAAVAVWQTGLGVRSKAHDFRAGLWMAYLAFAPVVLLWGVSQVQPIFIERALLPSGVAFLLWLAWALLAAPSPRIVRVAVLLLLFGGMAIGFYQHLTYRGFPYADYERLAGRIEEQAGTGTAVIHSNKLTALPTLYYGRESDLRFVADPPGSGSDTLALPTQAVLGVRASESIAEAAGESDVLLFVIFDRAINEYEGEGVGQHPQIAWLETKYHLTDREDWEDLLLLRYERTDHR